MSISNLCSFLSCLSWYIYGDMSAIYQWSAGKVLADYQPIDCSGRGLPTYCSRLDQLSTNIATDMLIDSQLRYWSIHRSTLPKRCMILFNYPLASMFMECLPIQWLTWWCLYQPRASMFMECLTGKLVGRVSRNPGASVLVECLPSHWQACQWSVYEPTG